MKKFIKSKNIILPALFVLTLIIAISYYFSRHTSKISLNEFKYLESVLEEKTNQVPEEKTNLQNDDIECKKSDEPISVITKLMDFVSVTLKIYLMIVSSDISKCLKDSYDKISYRCMDKNSIFYGDMLKSGKPKIEKIYTKIALQGLEMKSVISGGEGNFSQANFFFKNSMIGMEIKAFEGSSYIQTFEIEGYLNVKKIEEDFIIKYKGVFTNLSDEGYSIDFQKFSYLFTTSDGAVSGNMESSGCIKTSDICECFEAKSDKLGISIIGVVGQNTLCDVEGEIILNETKLRLSSGDIKIGEKSFFCDELYY